MTDEPLNPGEDQVRADGPGPDVQPPEAAEPGSPDAGAGGIDASAPADPWAHRRGEPRVFALLWTIYLFAITAVVFFGALAGPSISPEVMRSAARLVLLLSMMGMCLLWPMVRLSQTPDPQPMGGALRDYIVVMIPAQALIWPQVLWWLARWPMSTVGALAAATAAWGVLIAGLLALRAAGCVRIESDGAPNPWRFDAALWMVVFTVLAGAGVAVSTIVGEPRGPMDAALMLSPVGAVMELTRNVSWTGRSTPLTGSHWVLIGVVALAGTVVWAAAGLRSRRGPVGLRFTT